LLIDILVIPKLRAIFQNVDYFLLGKNPKTFTTDGLKNLIMMLQERILDIERI
jgi:hypothetical protein